MKTSSINLTVWPKIALICTLFVGSGCAINLDMAGNRMLTPESNGKTWKGAAAPLGMKSTSVLTVVPDLTRQPPDINDPKFTNSGFDYAGYTSVALVNRVDAYATIGLYSPPTIGMKFQILGDSRLDAKKGNFSITPTIAGGYRRESDTVTGVTASITTATVATIEASHKTSQTVFDTSLVFGYRLSETLLLFGGPFAVKQWVHTTINQPHGSPVFYTTGDSGTQIGVNAAVELGNERYFAVFEIAWSDITYGQDPKIQARDTRFYPGLLLGVRW